MKRKGVATTSTLVQVVAIVIALLVLLPVTIKFVMMTKQVDEKKCELSLLLNSVSKVVGEPIISPECKHNNIQITDEKLNSLSNDKSIKKIYDEAITLANKRTDIDSQAYSNEYDGSSINTNNAELKKWYVQKVVADELLDCWDKVGQGNYDLFSDWETNLWNCNINPDTKMHEDCETDASVIQDIKDIKRSADNLFVIPSYCLLCSRVKFEVSDINPVNPNKNLQFKELYLWMYQTPIPKKKTPYITELLINTYFHNDGQNHYGNYDVNTNLAVIYVKERRNKLGSKTSGLFSSLGIINSNEPYFKNERGEEVDYRQYTAVVPYSNLPEHCTFLVG